VLLRASDCDLDLRPRCGPSRRRSGSSTTSLIRPTCWP
jgi:hypothetical protein